MTVSKGAVGCGVYSGGGTVGGNEELYIDEGVDWSSSFGASTVGVYRGGKEMATVKKRMQKMIDDCFRTFSFKEIVFQKNGKYLHAKQR